MPKTCGAVGLRLTVCRMVPPGVGSRWTWRATDTATGESVEGPAWRTSKADVMRFLVRTFPAASIDIDDPWA